MSSLCTAIPRRPAPNLSSKQQSQQQVYSIAHTARCKLQLAADRPDRNLRFILGHAFTLDKLRLRMAEIEEDSSDDDDSDELPPAIRKQSVSFQSHSPRPNAPPINHERSPPPEQFAHLDDTDSDSDEEVEDEEEDDAGLSLQRFESGSARPPQMVDDDSSSDDEVEPKSPPPLSEAELQLITGNAGDEKLAELYEHVAGCPCHGEQTPVVSHVWEIPRKPGVEGPRQALIQVEG